MPAEPVRDDEVIDATKPVGVVQPINRAYYVLNALMDLRDELRGNAVSKRDMMAYSDSVRKVPRSFDANDEKAVRDLIRKLARELATEIYKPGAPA
jgi:hypothetical protein